MSIRLIVHMHAAPGQSAQFIAAVKERVASVEAEAGYEQYDIAQNVANPEQFVLMEQWATEAALEAHRALNATRPQMGAPHRVPPTVIEQYERA